MDSVVCPNAIDANDTDSRRCRWLVRSARSLAERSFDRATGFQFPVALQSRPNRFLVQWLETKMSLQGDKPPQSLRSRQRYMLLELN